MNDNSLVTRALKEMRFIQQQTWFRYCKPKSFYGFSHNFKNFKTDWYKNFRNTAFICDSNPLAFNGHHALFKVKPKLKFVNRSFRFWNDFHKRIGQVIWWGGDIDEKS